MTLNERRLKFAKETSRTARLLPPGKQREILPKKAHQTEAAANIENGLHRRVTTADLGFGRDHDAPVGHGGSPLSRASVLLVEDETLIRMMIAEMVEVLGHRVAAEAGSIEAGCELARDTDFDLAILDVNVRGSMVTPVAEIIAGRGLPILFVTGYGARGLPDAVRERPVLQKPFLIEKLSDSINAITGA